ncbi:MAG: hypothetical protein JNL28_02540 [Planctomycetes bacterium]|nr:hypothetical protein [Planctomycetota bacterium]
MNSARASWMPVVTGDGSLTFAHPVHGQTCHSKAGAWTESRERYAVACRVRERALEIKAAGATSFRLLDVGTGLGLNLAAALEALSGTGLTLDADTLEIDRSVIEATLAQGVATLADLERWHAPVRVALAGALRAPSGTPVECAGGTLRLYLGDGRESLRTLDPSARFDAVFLDPFSPGVDASLWEAQFLAEIARRMAPGSMLSTYTVSLGVRAALARAGLKVGCGAAVLTKAAGTLASPDREPLPLDAKTMRRLEARLARADGFRPEFRPASGFPDDA